MRCLAQGHLDTQLGGAGNRTSNLPATSRPLYLLSDMPPLSFPGSPTQLTKTADRWSPTVQLVSLLYLLMDLSVPLPLTGFSL